MMPTRIAYVRRREFMFGSSAVLVEMGSPADENTLG
jgi:hypothetical protein